MQVTANLLQEFANQITFFNTKVRILSQKKIRNKIKVYLQTQEISEDGTIQIPFSRNKMAEYSYMLIEVRYPENSVECVTVEYLHFPVLKLL